MADELKDVELRVLAYIEDYKKEHGAKVCYLDDMFEGFGQDERLEREEEFDKAVDRLREEGYIKRASADFAKGILMQDGARFGCYDITRKGVKALKA